jgi:hypothetical protein
MSVNLKNLWNNKTATHSLQDIANALAFNAWRIAQDKAIQLHSEHFNYQNDTQRMAVLNEYLFFQIHVVDRLVYELFNEAERRVVIVQLVSKLAELIQDNSVDLFGAGDYGHIFTNEMNKRNIEYGELVFNENVPTYSMLRHLGYSIQQIMGEHEENRWVIDQVMDKNGNEVYQQIIRTLRGLIS